MADETMAEVEACLARLEKALALPEGFVESLAREDDWSFLIKASALMEAALASLISAHLNSAELRRPLSYLEMGHPKYGKIALTKALGLTTPEERRFLSAVGELRNLCAHRVENIAFSFVRHVASLDENQKKSFAVAIGYFNLSEDANGKLYVDNPEEVLADPKGAIFNGLKVILGVSVLQSDTAAFKAEKAKLHEKLLESRNALERAGDS